MAAPGSLGEIIKVALRKHEVEIRIFAFHQPLPVGCAWDVSDAFPCLDDTCYLENTFRLLDV